MTALLADARGRWSRERSLIVAVGAPFLFLPAFAVQLLTAPPPTLPAERSEANLLGWVEAFAAWEQANGAWYLLASAAAVYGIAVLAVLLVDPAGPTVGEALTRGVRLWPRFLLAAVITAVPVGLGLWLLLPGLFFQARLCAAPPALVAERPISAAGAIARSWRVTARANGAAFGATALLFALQFVALLPIASLDGWLRAPSHLNPFVLALVDAAMAGVNALYQAAVLLLGAAIYRRTAS